MAFVELIRGALETRTLEDRPDPRRFLTLGLLLALLAGAVLFLPQMIDQQFRITWDGSFYLSEARYIFDGQGYVVEPGAPFLSRPPGFVGMLAAAFTVFGPTVSAATWVITLAGLAAVLIAAAMSYRMFGLAAALLAIAWIVPNAFVSEFLSRVLLLDMSQTVMTLGVVWLVFEAVRGGAVRAYVSAGVALAAAFWIKESALLLLPLPLVAILLNPQWQTWRHLRGLVAYGVAVGLLILPWFIYVYLETGTIYRMGSAARPDLLAIAALLLASGAVVALWAWYRWDRWRLWFLTLLRSALEPRTRLLLGWGVSVTLVAIATIAAGIPGPADLSRHFVERVQPMNLLPIGYLGPMVWAVIPLVWLFALRGALRRDPAHLVLVASLMVSIPLMAFVADRNLAPRNYLLVFVLTHVALAALTVNAIAHVWDYIRAKQPLGVSGAGDIAVGIVFGLTFLPPAQVIAQDLFSDSPGTLAQRSEIEQSELTEAWVRDNLPPGERIDVLASPGGAVLRFKLGDDYQSPWIRMEWIQREALTAGLNGSLPGEDRHGRPYDGLRGVVFLNVNTSPFVGDRDTERPELRVVQVPDLLPGQLPERLAWLKAGAARVFPDVIPEYLLNAGLAREIMEPQEGARVIELVENSVPNVLLVNEVALDNLDGANDDAVQLSPELAEALAGWQVIVLASDNSYGPPERQLCDDLREAVPESKCWNGLLEHPVVSGRNVPPLALEREWTPVTAQPLEHTRISASYFDGNGADDLRRMYFLANEQWDTENACYIQYDRVENQLYVYDDGWLPAGAPGKGQPAGSPMCMLDPSSTTVVSDGNKMQITFDLEFSPDFAGDYAGWLGVEDMDGEWSQRTEAGKLVVQSAEQPADG